MELNHIELLELLQNTPSLKIKVFNLGENLGMDFAYFGHYMALKKYFPNITIDLYRSNVDETNCIGLENYQGKVILPVDKMEMAIVSQRYPDGTDWCTKLNREDYSIFTDEFRSIENYDLILGIGYGSAPCWQKQYPSNTKFINANTIKAAIELYLKQENKLPELNKINLGINHSKIKPWERTALEYLVFDDSKYPFTFTEEYKSLVQASKYKNYLRVGLRWPDHVRWYYSIERQFEILINVLHRIRKQGKPVNLIFTLKDGEIGNNFNRGQTLQLLKRVQDMCDNCLFTYSWPFKPYHGRKTENQELDSLKHAGIKNVKKVDVWEDLLISSSCKVYLSDPGGFAEVISMLRKPHTTFLFPVSFQHSCTYITLDHDNNPINLKVNQIVADQFYDCTPVLSAPDDPEGYRTTHWNLQYLEDKRVIGDNCHGDDWMYFQAAQQTVFKDWYLATRESLIYNVCNEYLKVY